MKLTYFIAILAIILVGFAAYPSFALDIYIDPKTDQLYGKPGPGRVKLGTYKRVDEAEEIPAATQDQTTTQNQTATQEQITQEVKQQVEAATKDLPEINTKGKLQFKSKDGNFAWGIGGRIHAQGGIYDNDRTDNGVSTGFHDETSLRRARLNITATLWRHWQMKLQYDFAGSGDVAAGIRDAWLAYNNEKHWPVSVIMGQFKETYGLESFNLNSSVNQSLKLSKM